MVSKDKLKQLFSPSLTGKDTYSADEILLSIETMPDSEPTFKQVMEYCKAHNYVLVDNEFLPSVAKELRVIIDEWERENAKID